MITRIVRLPIDPEKMDEFMSIFERIKNEINDQPGCRSLRIFKQQDDSGALFTYSTWDNESDLHNYRNSELFKSTWPAVKLLFTEKAQAWTLSEL